MSAETTPTTAEERASWETDDGWKGMSLTDLQRLNADVARLERELGRVRAYSLCPEGLTVAGFMAGVQCPDCGMGKEHAEARAALPQEPGDET